MTAWRHILAGVLGAACLAVAVAIPALAPALTPIGGSLLLATGTSLLSPKKDTP